MTTIYDSVWEGWLDLTDKEIANTLRGRLAERQPLHALLAGQLQAVPAGGPQVLEMGCGTAIDAFALAGATGAQTFALDLSAQAVELAAKRISIHFDRAVHLLVGDALHTSFPDETFDLVFSQGVVEHFRDPRPIMVEQRRVLKKGGILVVDVPQRYNFYTLRKHQAMQRGQWPWGWETEYSYWELKRLGEAVGLKAIAAEGYGYNFDSKVFNLAFFRLLARRLQKRNPWREAWIFRTFEDAYERLWRWIERSVGAFFLGNIMMAFVKPVA